MSRRRYVNRGRSMVVGAVAACAIVSATAGATLIQGQAAGTFTKPSWALQIGQQGSAFVYPWGMAWDPTSNTMITSDYNNWQVRRFTPSGVARRHLQLEGGARRPAALRGRGRPDHRTTSSSTTSRGTCGTARRARC